jgi:hypothetical protein
MIVSQAKLATCRVTHHACQRSAHSRGAGQPIRPASGSARPALIRHPDPSPSPLPVNQASSAALQRDVQMAAAGLRVPPTTMRCAKEASARLVGCGGWLGWPEAAVMERAAGLLVMGQFGTMVERFSH